MKILYLCHRIPYPPDKGDKIRAYHEIRALSAKHDVDVFTLADDAEDLRYRPELAKYCRRLTVARVQRRLARLKALPFLLTRTPMTLPYFYSAELAAEVRKALHTDGYDCIFVYCSAMAQYVESAPDTVPLVIDFVDVDSDKWMQYANFSRFPSALVYRREGRFLREYERKICDQATSVLVSTEREARLLREISADTPVHVVSNGVDTAYFDPAVVPSQRTSPTVIFTGEMSYFPNQEAATYFAQKVLPLIRQSVPDARFLIVGRNPSPKVLGLREVDRIDVTGFVPDVRTYLAQAHVAVAPFSIAAGIQNKILEAMAFEVPVVATSRTVQGLSSAVAELVEIADTPETTASSVIRLLRDAEARESRGVAARARVAAEYRWDQAATRLLSLVSGSKAHATVHSR